MNDLALLLDLFGNSEETKLLICTAIFVWCLQRHRNGGLNSGQKSAIIVTNALHVDPLSFILNTLRNKQAEFNPYIYILSKLSHFGHEISVLRFPLYNFRSRVNLVHLNSSKTTSVTFGVVSTISVTRMKNSTFNLINNEKYLLGISKIENLFIQLMILLHIVKA